jgi:hypothetical protein
MVEEYERLSFKTVGTCRLANTGNSLVIEVYGRKCYVSVKDILEVLNGKAKLGTISELGKWRDGNE